jgi:hypothetical protein
MDQKEMGLEGVDWIHLALGRDRWRAVVSTVLKPRVNKPRGIRLAERSIRFSRRTLLWN